MFACPLKFDYGRGKCSLLNAECRMFPTQISLVEMSSDSSANINLAFPAQNGTLWCCLLPPYIHYPQVLVINVIFFSDKKDTCHQNGEEDADSKKADAFLVSVAAINDEQTSFHAELEREKSDDWFPTSMCHLMDYKQMTFMGCDIRMMIKMGPGGMVVRTQYALWKKDMTTVEWPCKLNTVREEGYGHKWPLIFGVVSWWYDVKAHGLLNEYC